MTRPMSRVLNVKPAYFRLFAKALSSAKRRACAKLSVLHLALIRDFRDFGKTRAHILSEYDEMFGIKSGTLLKKQYKR